MFNVDSSNPVLNDQKTFQQYYGEMAATRPTTATLQGVVNKTGILVGIAVVAGAAAYAFLPASTGILTASMFAAIIICFGVGMVMRGNPKIAAYVAPVYAVVEGAALGLLTSVLDKMLLNIDAAAAMAEGGGAATRVSLALPAFIITISVTVAMLGLYSARILQPTRRFTAVVSTLAVGVMITYALTWVLGMFGVSIPFLRLTSAFEGGWAPLIGIGISVFILGIASLMLIIDFGRVEEIVKSGQPRYMEWYAGFGLLVTLAWIYYEAVKLSFRIAVLLSSRE